MADFLNDPIGSKYGCSYRYTNGVLGTFGALLNEPVNPRKVKDPMPLDGADFMAIDPPFAPVVKIGSYIQLLTTYTYPTNTYVLGGGTEEISKEQVDFSKFKKVINFTSLGKFTITAIPKDQLLVSKNLVDTSNFANGIGYIGITATNATVYVALTKDNVNWVKYDTENEEWVSVDLTATTDELKTTMMPLNTLSTLTTTEYSKYFRALDYVGIAMVVSIEPTSVNSETGEETYDITKSYTVTPIEINFVGDDNASSDPITHYFNFIKVGYTPKGDPLLIADRVIQTNIAYSALNNDTYDYYSGSTKAPMSTPNQPMYMRLLNGSGKSDEDEYTKIILNAPQAILNGKTVDQVFNINLGSMTNIVATSEDDEGTASGNTKIVYRGGESLATRVKNIAYNASNSSYGWRPVLEIDCTSKEATQIYPGAPLPEVKSIGQLTKGKCISCDFIYNYDKNGIYSGTAYFSNMGNAQLAPLSDYKNLKSGSFYFICVGYNNKGERILIADRPIATPSSKTNLISFLQTICLPNSKYNGTENVYFTNEETSISGGGKFYLTLPTASNSPSEVEWENGFWNNVITNEYDKTKSIDQIWHTDKISTITASISSEKENYLIIKGGEDMSKHLTRQKSVLVTTSSEARVNQVRFAEVGFRPMLIVPNEYRVDQFKVNFKTGYSVNKNQDTFEVTCHVLDPNNIELPFKLVELNSGLEDATPTGVELSPYDTNITRTIPVSKFTVMEGPSYENKYYAFIGVIVKVNGVDTIVHKTTNIIDKPYRLVSGREFSSDHGGWKTVGTTAKQFKIDPIIDVKKETTRNSNGTYVEVSSVTNRIKF